MLMLEYEFITLHRHPGHKIILHDNTILYEKPKDKSLYKKDYLTENINGSADDMMTRCEIVF